MYAVNVLIQMTVGYYYAPVANMFACVLTNSTSQQHCRDMKVKMEIFTPFCFILQAK